MPIASLGNNETTDVPVKRGRTFLARSRSNAASQVPSMRAAMEPGGAGVARHSADCRRMPQSRKLALRLVGTDVHSEGKRITQPTLVIHGEVGQDCPARARQRIGGPHSLTPRVAFSPDAGMCRR